MATRTQAKNAIDVAVTGVKADIDLLPATSNITDGNISFNPTKWTILIAAIDANDAAAFETAFSANLVAASRPFTITRQRRRGDGLRGIVFDAGNGSIRIIY